MTEIEKLTKERDEAIAAALELAESLRQRVPISIKDSAIEEKLAAVEALRPEPELVEGWVNVYPKGPSQMYGTADRAIEGSSRSVVRAAVHVREVRPVKWERWNAIDGGVYGQKTLGARAKDHYEACRIAAAHNADMERLERGESV